MQNIKIPGWIPSILLTVVPVLIVWLRGAGENSLIDAGVAASIVAGLATIMKLLEVFLSSNGLLPEVQASQSRGIDDYQVTLEVTEESKLTRFLLG